MSDDMPTHIPDFIPPHFIPSDSSHPAPSAAGAESVVDDWVEAHVETINGSVLTFSAGGESHVQHYSDPLAALLTFATLKDDFEYSAHRHQARLSTGRVIAFPTGANLRTRCSAEECDLVVAGHRPFWAPVLRASNGPIEQWVPIEVLNVEGVKATFATPTGQITVYNHQPQLLARAVEMHEKHHVLRCAPTTDPETGHRSHRVLWGSREPITACSKA